MSVPPHVLTVKADRRYKGFVAHDIPSPGPRLKWLSSMIHDLLMVDDRWSGAKLFDETDPLAKQFVIYCRRPVPDPAWLFLKRTIRAWAEQNDCVAKEIRRYKNRIEVRILLKYLNRESDFSPHEALPSWETKWRTLND